MLLRLLVVTLRTRKRMKKNNKKGFTLAELLIVVAIIAVLTAIAIPVFSAQLEKSREATDMANVRAAYATLVTGYLENPSPNSVSVPVKQGQPGWETSDGGHLELMVDGSTTEYSYAAKTSGNYIVAIDSTGSITVS